MTYMTKIESATYLYTCPKCDSTVNIQVSEAPTSVKCFKCNTEMQNIGTLTVSSESKIDIN